VKRWELIAGAFGAIGVTVAALLADSAYEDLATGIETMDRFPIRGRVLLYSFLFGVDARVIMAIIHNESRGDTDNYLGDVNASGGPSVGPGQVYRTTAKALGMWSPPPGLDERAAYADMALDEDWGVRACIHVFKDKLSIAGGDVAKAIALYNGTPTLPAVQTYRANALAFLSDSYDLELST
jgi:soluble lytic murein transglycosylase-like protein